MNRLIREFSIAHPNLRQKLNKYLNAELKLRIKIGFPPDISNYVNVLNMKLIKIIVEDGD